MKSIGYTWLVEHYGLKGRPLTHRSFLGTKMHRQELANGVIEEHYINSYDPGENPLNHLTFALKYDDLDLDLISKIFRHITPQEAADFIIEKPSSKFARQIGFWYEELTAMKIPLSRDVSGNYEPLLDAERYVVSSKVIKNSRWRINNNAAGSRQFFPVIRRTPAICALQKIDWHKMLEQVLKPFSPESLYRAFSYLYFKETKSSFAIEREKPGASRIGKFVAVLHHAGSEEFPLSEKNLAHVQNAIVEERYCEKGFRSCQNYIGQTKNYFREIVHSIGAPPECLDDIMEGVALYFQKSEAMAPLERAAAISFPFVFIHPFEDGNGRIHRYLIHDLLARGKIGGEGVILPISAEILLNYRLYDACLEKFSQPLMALANYTLSNQGELTVHNPREIEGFYRYPDVTAACEFLAQMLELTIRETIPQEIQFLQKYDKVHQAITEIVDLPDHKMKSLLERLRKNGGKLARKRREGEFAELTDAEIAEIEKSYKTIFST